MVNYKSAIVKCGPSLLEELREEQTDFLKNILNSPKKIERIFKASEHNFGCAAFHKKCDNKSDTLVLVRTEFSRTIGGYTHYPWDQRNSYLSDANMRTFLFSLDLKEKYIPIDESNLIHGYSGYGPTFGDGHDLYLADSCNSNTSSYTNFPHRYNRAGENGIINNQESYTNFAGATNGKNFRVLEYEVFQVLYQWLCSHWFILSFFIKY